jgi:toxin ParE1/3/4
MSRVRLSLETSRDLEGIESYIFQDNPDAAARLIRLVRKKCELLSMQPGMGRDRLDVSSGLRGFPVGNYVIFYQTSNDGIEIIRVFHGSRDISELFD